MCILAKMQNDPKQPEELVASKATRKDLQQKIY